MLVVGVAALAGCARAPDPVLRIGANNWLGYEPLHLARDLGLLPRDGVKLVQYSSNSLNRGAYVNGAIEATCLTLDELLVAKEAGAEARIVLVLDISEGADALLAQPGIDGLAALRGKRIGVEDSAVGAYMLTRALEHAGLERDEVNIVPLELNEHQRAFQSGRVEALVTFEPVRSRLMTDGAQVLFDSGDIPGEVVDVLAVRPAFLDAHPQRVAAVADAWFRSLDLLEDEPDRAFERMRLRQRQSPAELHRALSELHFPDRRRNAELLDGPDPGLLTTARRLADVMRERGLLAHDVDVASLFGPRP